MFCGRCHKRVELCVCIGGPLKRSSKSLSGQERPLSQTLLEQGARERARLRRPSPTDWLVRSQQQRLRQLQVGQPRPGNRQGLQDIDPFVNLSLQELLRQVGLQEERQQPEVSPEEVFRRAELKDIMARDDGPELNVPERVLAFLRAQSRVRFYIENSNNFGHQSNTINIAWILRVVGYEGEMEILVRGDQIPGLKGMFPWLVEDGAVTLVDYDEFDRYELEGPGVRPLLCVTGGFDNNDNEALHNPPRDVGVNCFLAVQPYCFEQISEHSQSRVYTLTEAGIDQGDDPDVTNLCKQLKGKDFAHAVFWPPYIPSTWKVCDELLAALSENWRAAEFSHEGEESRKAQAKAKRSAHILRCVTQALFSEAGRYHVAALYGLRKNLSIPEDKSAVILFRYAYALSLCKLDRLAVLAVFHDEIDVGTLSGLLSEPKASDICVLNLPSVSTASALHGILDQQSRLGKRVVILKIGRVPQFLFNFYYTACTLPCVFEGEGSTPVVFSSGRPFFYMKGPGAKTDASFYPSLDGFSKLAKSLQRVANALFSATQAEDVCLGLLFKFFRLALEGNNALCSYFEALQAHCADPAHNRLLLALGRAIDELIALDLYDPKSQ